MNYGELKAQFLEVLNRDDCTDALADTFMRQAISRVHRMLRVPSMEREDTLLTDENGELTIPSNYLEMISLSYNGEYQLVRKRLGDLMRLKDRGTRPRFYARRGGKWVIAPTQGAGVPIDIVYYGDLLELVEDEDSDPLLVIANDLFIYGALAYAADYFLDERKDAFEARFMQIGEELQVQAANQEFSEGPLAVEPGTTTDY